MGLDRRAAENAPMPVLQGLRLACSQQLLALEPGTPGALTERTPPPLAHRTRDLLGTFWGINKPIFQMFTMFRTFLGDVDLQKLQLRRL